MTKIAIIQPDVILEWEKGNLKKIFNSVKQNIALNKFEIVNDISGADLIVLLDTCTFKTQKNIKEFEGLLKFNQGDKRLCTLNYEDSPPGFLPGLYSSLETYKFDNDIHISWPHLAIHNEFIYCGRLKNCKENKTLFTFSGACSSPVRRKIFDLYENHSGKYKVLEVKKWYNHNKDEKVSYVNDMMESKFVLCPQGIASYSHRIIETLAMGKVPVVIADNWVPFTIPEKNYYLKIPEKDIPNIVKILEEKEDEFEDLKENAINVYNKYFDQSLCYSMALNQLSNLYNTKLSGISSDYLKNLWNSRKFWKKNKWCIEDRIIRKINKAVKLIN